MASDSQGCDRTARGTSALVGTHPGHSPQGWGLCRDLRDALMPPAWAFSSWNLRLFTKKQLNDGRDRNSSSCQRWEFIQWQAYMITGVLNSLCFSQREKQFPLEGFIFFLSNISKVSIIFFLAIASIPSSRETQRSKSLLHLSPKSPSHFWKAGCSWGTAFPVCKFNVAFLLHLWMWNPLVFNMICSESTAKV